MRHGDKPAAPRSPLGAVQPKPMDVEEIKREAWHREGILVISRHDVRLGWDEAQMVKQLGEKLHGKAKAR